MVHAVEWIFLAYFIGLQGTYLAITMIALPSVVRHVREGALDGLPRQYSDLDPPISIIVPAWNEAASIAAGVRALLDLRYAEHEVIVVNDGSTDDTLEVLTRSFALQEVPSLPWARVTTAPVRASFVSARYANLRVVDKHNGGGKADALNAGINVARYPLVCVVDGDSVLAPDALRVAARPFIDDPKTVAVGGSVRVANGCLVRGGVMEEVRLPASALARFQVVEYQRAFLGGRMGWSGLNAALIVSGAFGLFRTDVLVAAGGYRSDAIGEDMELATRMHRHLRATGQPYRIAFVPNPVCWTEVPEDLRSLGRQRIRWHRGLGQALWLNRRLLADRNGGAAGWLAFPFYFLFECLGPVLELTGIVYLLLAVVLGLVSMSSFVAFSVLALASSLLLSAGALMLDDLSYGVYRERGDLARLVLAAIVENFGYRQLNTVWRIVGLGAWLGGRSATWKPVRRSGGWNRSLEPV